MTIFVLDMSLLTSLLVIVIELSGVQFGMTSFESFEIA